MWKYHKCRREFSMEPKMFKNLGLGFLWWGCCITYAIVLGSSCVVKFWIFFCEIFFAGGLELLSSCQCGNKKRLLTCLRKRYPKFGGLCWVCSKCNKYFNVFDEHSVYAKIAGKFSSWTPCQLLKAVEGIALTFRIKEVANKTGVNRMWAKY